MPEKVYRVSRNKYHQEKTSSNSKLKTIRWKTQLTFLKSQNTFNNILPVDILKYQNSKSKVLKICRILLHISKPISSFQVVRTDKANRSIFQ